MRITGRAVAAEIRSEETRDRRVVRAVNELAFGRPDEALLVDALRESPGSVSLIAAIDGRIVGHILFTLVRIDRTVPGQTAAGLGPLAVHPEFQRRGVGAALVRAGLDASRLQRRALAFVLGNPAFYSRFGFVPAHTKGLQFERPAPADAFMVAELYPDASRHFGGIVRYDAAFGRA